MFADEIEEEGRVRVKICGITNAPDAIAAMECGADALGFNFFPGSKRYIDGLATAQEWMTALPRNIPKVAVLVNPTRAHAEEVARLPFIDALQFHGEESPAFCQSIAQLGIAFTKVLPVSDARSLKDVPSFFTRNIMLDSRSSHGFGGTGQTFPWMLGRQFVDAHPDLRIILAGGLTPENVADAVRQVRPFAVDVSSGVETAPGRKDWPRLRDFIDAVRGS